MNFLIIKSIIEATIANFHCKDCNSHITERDLNILGTAGNSVNLEIICPKCKLQGVVKAEVGMTNLGNLQNPELAQTLRQFSEGMKNGGFLHNEENSIKDEDILSIRKGLQENVSFQDLFQ
jgi:phage FluMu protein Com